MKSWQKYGIWALVIFLLASAPITMAHITQEVAGVLGEAAKGLVIYAKHLDLK